MSNRKKNSRKKKSSSKKERETIFTIIKKAVNLELSSEVGKVNVTLFALVIAFLCINYDPNILIFFLDIFRILAIVVLKIFNRDVTELLNMPYSAITNNDSILAFSIVLLGFIVCMGLVYSLDKSIKNRKTK